MDDPVLEVRGLAKSYRVYGHPRDKLKQAFWRRRRTYFREFEALKDVSFQLNRGDVIGVVGRNGSGKSTLLKLIYGTLRPSRGEVKKKGRVAALLELASGFDREFTGIDNLYMNAALLGFSDREIADRLETILEFAGLGDFIDKPVKTYSSGMVMRLAFAVQVHAEPDLLLIDEALAVGDEIFQRRCMHRLQELRAAGTTIMLVSHSNQAIVQHCNRAMLLVAGQMKLLDTPKTVIRVYERLSYAPDHQWPALLDQINRLMQEEPPRPPDQLPGSKPEQQAGQVKPGMKKGPQAPTIVEYEPRGAEIVAFEVLDPDGNPVNLLPLGCAFALRFHYAVAEVIEEPILGCNVSDCRGLLVSGQGASFAAGYPGCPPRLEPGRWSATFWFAGGLMPGLYFVNCALSSNQPARPIHKLRDACQFRVSSLQVPSSFGVVDLAAQPAQFTRVEPPPAARGAAAKGG